MSDVDRIRARFTKISKIVKRQLEIHNIGSAPIPLLDLISTYRIDLRSGDLGEVCGIIVRKGDSVTIGVNSQLSRVQKRFTIAHEFGHFLLHEGIADHVDREYRMNFSSSEANNSSDVIEIEANFFADNLLMPKEFLDNENSERALYSEQHLKIIARKFRVSELAMSRQLSRVYSKR